MDERTAAFFEDVGASIDVFVADLTSGLTDPASRSDKERARFVTLASAVATTEQRQALQSATRAALVGLADSIMVTLDGGTAYSNHGAPTLLHPDGTPFPEGLHEGLVEYLDATGRLV
jgi:NAD(P)-dependent dehydrogenase (short-subunit alcohol dehydrogenase family)